LFHDPGEASHLHRGLSKPRGVAQIFNLLYRRFVICIGPKHASHLENPSDADSKSAIQQIKNLRYGFAKLDKTAMRPQPSDFRDGS
jgi:hypothetical protein